MIDFLKKLGKAIDLGEVKSFDETKEAEVQDNTETKNISLDEFLKGCHIPDFDREANADDVIKALKLSSNSKLKEEVKLLFKLANDKSWRVFRWEDVESLCEYAININDVRNAYYLDVTNLRNILRTISLAKIDGVSLFPPKPKRPMVYCEPDSLSDYFRFDKSMREDMHSLFNVAKDLGKDIKTWDDLKYYCMFVRMNKSVQRKYLLFEESLRKIENSMIVSRGYYLDFPFESEELLEDINQGKQSEDGINGVVTGEEFEQYCAKLLTSNGYENVELTPGSGDHGVDITAEKDYVTYAIQCKFYSSPVGNSAVQEVFSGKKIYGKDIAVVMTNNVFTSQAIDDAKQLGVKLWDKDILEKMSKA